MASNYQDILDQLRAGGLVVDALEVGRIIRCKVEGDRERRGWYVLHEITTGTGDHLLVGSFGVWHGNDQATTKLEIRGGKSQLNDDQRELLRQRMREDRARAEADRKSIARKAAIRASAAWAKYSPTGESDYLARKGVADYGVRFSEAGSLIIPMLDGAGVVHGLQIIRGKKALEANAKRQRPRREKEFWPIGVEKKGHFHLIGMPTWIVLVCEGYATGASLHAATGLPVAIAFDAGNLAPVALALRARYRQARILICADDDIFAHHKTNRGVEGCGGRIVVPEHNTTCPHCGKEHGRSNTGVSEASTAAVAANGSFIVPRFADEPGRRTLFLERGIKLTDFNDLQNAGADGLYKVRLQVETRLTELHWTAKNTAVSTTTAGQGGSTLKPIETVDELLTRFALVYGQAGTVFDRQEHCLVALSDVRDACISRYVHRFWMEHPARAIVRIRDVGFDPGGKDPNVTCNLWDGWPTKPQAGTCDKLLEILRYMCSADDQSEKLYNWVLRWLAYPIKVPGAKMKTTVVVHGPEGAGKNIFFDAVLSIYERYGRVIGQDAIEDRFNDWASKKLFLIANEVVARSELYHVKNKLKSLITDDLIRINPKGMAAYDERNHVNLVFLSNEMMPVVLAEDDRRYAVIYTPPPLPAEFYEAVAAELRAGGAAALHAHLLALDIGDFNEHTKPLLNSAKLELIEQSRDNISRFYFDLQDGDCYGITAMPARTTSVFEAYQFWCRKTGHRHASMNKMVSTFIRKHGVEQIRERWRDSFGSEKGPHGVLLLGGSRYEAPPGKDRKAWLGECVEAFEAQLKDASKAAA